MGTCHWHASTRSYIRGITTLEYIYNAFISNYLFNNFIYISNKHTITILPTFNYLSSPTILRHDKNRTLRSSITTKKVFQHKHFDKFELNTSSALIF
jgi:hypothetical protein